MTKALVIRTDNTMEFIDSNGYQDIMNAVGGLIQAVYFGDNSYFCYVNEEGKLIGLPENKIATSLWYDSGQRIQIGDFLAGNAIFFGGIDFEGNDVDIEDDFINLIEKYN